MDMLAVAIVLSAVGVACYVLYKRSRQAESDLTRACRGDAAQADRLIAHELRRAPKLSRKQAAARALAQLRYENR
jgi:hypothetical protein